MLNTEDRLDEQLLEAVRDLNAQLQRYFGAALRARGVSLARLKLLKFIQRSGSVRSTDVAEAFGYAPRTITEGLDASERDGLIRRDPDPADRRAKRITLTPAGLCVLEETAPFLPAIRSRVFEAMAHEDQAELLRMLQLLNEHVGGLDAQEDAGAGNRAPIGSGQK